jgi:hypothetical protein
MSQVPDFHPFLNSFAPPLQQVSSKRIFSFMCDSNGDVVLRTKVNGTDAIWSEPIVLLPANLDIAEVQLNVAKYNVSHP